MFPVSLAKRDQTCLISHQASYKYIYILVYLTVLYIHTVSTTRLARIKTYSTLLLRVSLTV